MNQLETTIYEGENCWSKEAQQEMKVVMEGLRSYSLEGGFQPFQREGFVIILKNGAGEVIAGCCAGVARNKLELEAGWIRPSYRRSGIGSKFIALAEEMGIKRGANISFVWTASFQAPGFYEKLGYEKVVTLPEVPTGHKTYGYMKILKPKNG